MISKCANPDCRAVFRYLHEGKLFEFEKRSLAAASVGVRGMERNAPAREIECFWLCDACAFTMTLIMDAHSHEVAIVPLQNAKGSPDAVDGISTRESQ